MEENASLFTNDSATPCDLNIINQNSDTDNTNDTNIPNALKQFGIHSQNKHKYRNTFGKSNIQYHDFDNQDALTFAGKYMALLQQELQNPYWCLHDPVTTKSYQISKDMDIETMPHTMYFTGNTDTVTKINHVPYQTIVYNENSMFTTKLMNDTLVEIFIDIGATPSILPLHTYNKFPILHTYPKTESNTPIHTGGGLIKSHFWLEILLKLDHQTIQIKALVCDPECPYDIVLGWTSMAQLSAWQDYASHKLYIQQISVPLTVRNNVRILPGKTGVVSLTLQPNKTSFTPRHTIRSKDLVQTNNSKHFPIDQYLHDRMTPATLSPTPLAYEKPIHPTEMPHITTCTELSVDDINKPIPDDKSPWLESDDIRRNMTDSEILRMKLNLKDSMLDEKGKEEFLKNVEQFT